MMTLLLPLPVLIGRIANSQEPMGARYLAVVDMVRAEEKLSVEVGLVDRIQIHHLDVLKARLHQVLQQLASCPPHPGKPNMPANTSDRLYPSPLYTLHTLDISDPQYALERSDRSYPSPLHGSDISYPSQLHRSDRSDPSPLHRLDVSYPSPFHRSDISDHIRSTPLAQIGQIISDIQCTDRTDHMLLSQELGRSEQIDTRVT